MRRREFITLLGGAAAAWPPVALAQALARRPRIALLGGSGPRPAAKVAGAFIEGMHALRYTEAATSRWTMDGPKAAWIVSLRSLKNWYDEEPT